MTYTTTRLEEYVKNIFINLGICHPQDIDMEAIAKGLNINIHYRESMSQMVCIKGQYHIILNQFDSPVKQWQDFTHELGHALKHVGNQRMLNGLFKGLQEGQANNFMYHFCVPTFMLMEFEFHATKDMTIQKIAESFGVSITFAKKRFEMYERKIYEYEFTKQMEEKLIEDKKERHRSGKELTHNLKPITMQQVYLKPNDYVLIDCYGAQFYITKNEYEVYEYIKKAENFFLRLTPGNIELEFRNFLNEFNIKEYENERLKRNGGVKSAYS
jgi:Zn-dependent peptidase ImmA (M78 family)